MSTTESLARFIIENPVLPCDTMEQLIGARPSCTWKPGDPIANTKLERKSYGCAFESKLPRTAGLECHVESLLNELRPAASAIRGLPKLKYNLLFSCVIYCSERPTLYFDHRTIASIKDLGADFDIDLYVLPGAE